MYATQISIFLENKSGRLAAATQALEDIGVNIRALNIADTSDFGILRIIVDNPIKVCSLLKDAGFAARLTDVVAVAIPDEPGGLNKMLRILEKSSISLEYLYAYLGKDKDSAVTVLRLTDLEKAVKVLNDEGYKTLDDKELVAV